MDRELLRSVAKDWGLAVVVVVGALTVWNMIAAPVSMPSGKMAPDFTLPRVDGGELTLSDLQGKTVILNFWATWCGPCKREIPDFVAFHNEHPEIEMIGISTDTGMPTARLKSYVKRLGINYTVLHDAKDAIAYPLFGVSSIPTTYVLRADGSIKSAKAGMLSKRRLEDLVYKE